MRSLFPRGKRFAVAANGLVIAGVIAIVVTHSTRVPNQVVQAKQEGNKQVVDGQIDELVKAVETVADSYTQSWENKNAPATVEVLKLYKDVMIKEVRQTVAKSLTQPLAQERFSTLESALQNYVENRYEFFMAKRASKNTNIYDIEDAEYTSRKVLAMWQNKGENLFAHEWNYNVLYKIEVLKRGDSSKEARIGLKKDVRELSDFVQAEIAKRFPGVSMSQLSDYSIKSKNNYLGMVEDPTSSFEKRLDRKSWQKKADDFFEKYSGLKKNNPEKSKSGLIELYESLFGTLFIESFVPVDSALISTKGNYDSKGLIEYLREIQDFPNRSKFHALLLSPFVKQRWVEQEAANSILRFGSEVIPSQ